MAKQRDFGVRSRERMTERPAAAASAISPSLSAQGGPDVPRNAPVESALPLLQSPADWATVRTLANLVDTALRVLSETDSDEAEVLEWLHDNVKPLLDTAHHLLRKVQR